MEEEEDGEEGWRALALAELEAELKVVKAEPGDGWTARSRELATQLADAARPATDARKGCAVLCDRASCRSCTPRATLSFYAVSDCL